MESLQNEMHVYVYSALEQPAFCHYRALAMVVTVSACLCAKSSLIYRHLCNYALCFCMCVCVWYV